MLSAVRSLDKDLEITVDKERIDMAVTQIDLLHRKDDGFITIAFKDHKEFKQHHYTLHSLDMNIGKALSFQDVNVYITPNSFYKPFRKIENIRKLNALFLDIYFYNSTEFKDYDYERIIYLLEKDYFKIKVPSPNFIIKTGRGLAIYWLIEPVPYKVLPLWNAVQRYFLECLKDIGADPKSIDCTRLMRLCGSINQKNKVMSEIEIYDDYIYTLREIQEEYLPSLSPYVKNQNHKKKGRKSKVEKLFTLHNLHYNRLLDLVKLMELRKGYCTDKNGQLVEDGQREIMCFLYRYWSNCFIGDKGESLRNTLEFNAKFKKPLTEREVENITASADKAYEEWRLNEFNLKKDESGDIIDKECVKKLNKLRKDRKEFKLYGYNYKNETLIDIFYITREEMKELNTIIDEEEKRRRDKESKKALRRDEDGRTHREIEKINKINDIKALINEGLSYREIAKKLHLNPSTVFRYSHG